MWPFGGRFFPGTNQQDLNLDWIIQRVRDLSKGILAPYINPANYHWMVYDTNAETFVDSGVSAAGEGTGPQGEPGKSPVIGSNGNWYVWDTETEAYTDTGISAQGPAGPQGEPGKSPVIGSNGNWNVWDTETEAYTDTGISAQGPQGERGLGVNRNLAINWYFVGGGSQSGFGNFPVNQRGQTSYSNIGPTVDCWRISGATGVVDFPTENDGLRIQGNPGGSTTTLFNQDFKDLSIRAYDRIFSVLTKEHGLVSLSVPANRASNIASSTAFGSLRYTIAANRDVYSIGVLPDVTITVIAVKLEFGTAQTLARQVNNAWILGELPDFSEELLKSQRWFQTYRTEALRPTYGADCRPVMAADEPTKSTITIDGVTYYTLTASTM